MKVVVDTNVFVSSFFGGNPRRIIDLWKTGDIQLCVSAPMVEEYVAVLNRLGLQGEHELEALLTLFAQGHHILFAAKTPTLSIVEKDPDDNKFIECAVALHADCVVSGDKAVTAVKEYMGIKIFTPRQFLLHLQTR